MLRYIADGFFTKPPEHPQGRGKKVRYFPDEWYVRNMAALEESRGRGIDAPT